MFHAFLYQARKSPSDRTIGCCHLNIARTLAQNGGRVSIAVRFSPNFSAIAELRKGCHSRRAMRSGSCRLSHSSQTLWQTVMALRVGRLLEGLSFLLWTNLLGITNVRGFYI